MNLYNWLDFHFRSILQENSSLQRYLLTFHLFNNKITHLIKMFHIKGNRVLYQFQSERNSNIKRIAYAAV